MYVGRCGFTYAFIASESNIFIPYNKQTVTENIRRLPERCRHNILVSKDNLVNQSQAVPWVQNPLGDMKIGELLHSVI
jgi:hypothetical protein